MSAAAILKDNDDAVAVHDGKLERTTAVIVADNVRTAELAELFNSGMAIVPGTALVPHGDEMLIYQANKHMTRNERAWWQTEMTRAQAMTLFRSSDTGQKIVPYDPIISCRRHSAFEDRRRTLQDLQRLVPAYEKLLAPGIDRIRRTFENHFGEATRVGTDADVPVLCHDRINLCDARVTIGCTDPDFYRSFQVFGATSRLLSVTVVPSHRERNCVIGAIALPVAIPMPGAKRKRVLVHVELLRLYDHVSERRAHPSKILAFDAVLDVMSMASYVERQLDGTAPTAPHAAGAMAPFAYLESRRYHTLDSTLRRLHEWEPFRTDVDDVVLAHLASRFRSLYHRLEAEDGDGARHPVFDPAHRRDTSTRSRAFKANARFTYRITVDTLMASVAMRRAKGGLFPQISFFSPRVVDD